MKNVRTFFATLITITTLTSCQKEFELVNSPTPSSTGGSSSKVKTYTEAITSSSQQTSTTFNLSYDAEDRIEDMISVTLPGDKFVYTYTANTFSVDIYNSSKLSIRSLYFINDMSLVDSCIQYNESQDTMTEKYIYNSKQQLVQLKEYDYFTTTGAVLRNVSYYEYNNSGNKVKDSTADFIKIYEYYDELPDNLNMGNTYLSKPNKNLLKTTTFMGHGVTETTNHTYTFDSYNRITNEKVALSTGDVVLRSYTY